MGKLIVVRSVKREHLDEDKLALALMMLARSIHEQPKVATKAKVPGTDAEPLRKVA